MKKQSAFENTFTFDNGYVFYESLNDDQLKRNIWRRIYQSAMSEFDQHLTFYNTVSSSDIGQMLINQGYAEQRKELRFLNQNYGIPENPIPIKQYNEYINKINQLMGLKENYRNLLTLMKQGYKNRGNEGKDRAYTATAYFESYYGTQIRDGFDVFLRTEKAKQLILNDDKATFCAELKQIAQDAILKTFTEISKRTDSVDGQSFQLWQNVLNLLKSADTQLRQLQSEVLKRYDIDKIINDIYTWDKERRADGKRTNSLRGLRKNIDFTLKKSEIKSRINAGYIEEYMSQAFASGTAIGVDGARNIRGGVIKSNIAKTDSVLLSSTEIEVSLDSMINEMNKVMSSSHSLEDASRILTDFYYNYLDKMPNTFVIYENTKAYSLGKNFGGFSGGASQPLSNLPHVLDSMGVKLDGEGLVTALYNTMNGAIGQDYKDELKNDTSRVLSAYMANFLFDDWDLIGDTTNNAIHMFNLDSIRVPLSYLLIATGTAMQQVAANPNSYFHVSIHTPKETIWNETDGHITPFDTSVGMVNYWNQQRSAALNGSTFSIKFLSNFKTIVKGLLNAL